MTRTAGRALRGTRSGPRWVPGNLDATDITPWLWRSVSLHMPKSDGSIAKLQAKRPLWWFAATVLAIGPCPADSRSQPSDQHIVAGTIRHENAEV